MTTGLIILLTLTPLLLVAERARPLRPRRASFARRLVVNGTLAVLALVVASTVIRPVARTLMDLRGDLGLIHLVTLPVWAQTAAALLLMDLTFYWWHRANHRIGALWRFHVIHHIDPDLDLTTGVRFHPGELVISAGFRAAQVTLIGVSAGTYLLYETIFQVANLFHHSNLRLPFKLERALSTVLVTPRMHGIHHSQVEHETHSNYSVVLCLWDRLHRTIQLHVPQRRIAIGVPALAAPQANTVRAMLTSPFGRQPRWWQRPDGTTPTRPPSETGPRPGRLEP